jgi:hypothetical protein
MHKSIITLSVLPTPAVVASSLLVVTPLTDVVVKKSIVEVAGR